MYCTIRIRTAEALVALNRSHRGLHRAGRDVVCCRVGGHARRRTRRSPTRGPRPGRERARAPAAAARTELREETGMLLPIGPWVWFRRHVFVWEGRRHDQYERFFVARTRRLPELIAPILRGEFPARALDCGV